MWDKLTLEILPITSSSASFFHIVVLPQKQEWLSTWTTVFITTGHPLTCQSTFTAQFVGFFCTGKTLG